MSNKINVVSLKLNDSKKFIEANVALQIKNPRAPRIYVAGAPGCGKSDMIMEICREHGWGLAVRYISNMALEQLTGLPVKPEAGQSTAWSKPEIFNFNDLEYRPKGYKEGVTPTILLLDDFHLSDKMMQKYMFQLLTYMKLNGYPLPANSAIILAGNRMEDKAGAQPIPAPVCNRMMFVDVHSDAEDWLKNFAFANGVRNDVCTFINNNKQYLHGDPIETTAWASPRSWTFLSNQMDVFESQGPMDLDALRVLAAGLIGEQVAAEFILYRELFSKWEFDDLFKMKDQDLVLKKFKDAIEKNTLNVYAIINSAISWMINKYQDSQYKLTDEVNEKIHYTYNTLASILTIKNTKVNIGPMLIAGLKYLKILQDVKVMNINGKQCYQELLKEFFSDMGKQRNADWIFFEIVQEIAGNKITDQQAEKIAKAKESIQLAC